MKRDGNRDIMELFLERIRMRFSANSLKNLEVGRGHGHDLGLAQDLAIALQGRETSTYLGVECRSA